MCEEKFSPCCTLISDEEIRLIFPGRKLTDRDVERICSLLSEAVWNILDIPGLVRQIGSALMDSRAEA